MPQPVTYNPGTPVSGSIQENSISYVVDGQNRNYRGGFGGLSWMSEVPAANNVIFIGNSTSLGRGPANIPLFYPSYNNSAANIIYAANTLPGSPRNFTTTGSAYNWAVTNNFFINNSNNPIPRIDADGLVLYVDANQPTSYPQTGTSVYDLSGRNNNGTLINGTAWDSNGWFDFDGVDDYIDCGSGMSATGKITVNALVKLDTFSNPGGSNHIVDSSANSWHLAVLTNGVPYFWNGTTYHTTGTPLSTGRWYMLTGVQGTTLDIYVNGELNNSLNSNLNIATNNVWIGAWQSGARFLNGQVSNTQIYPKALTTTEIKQNYFQGNIVTGSLVFMVDANNLVSYPKSGTSWYNLTGSSGNALLYNGPTYVPQYGGGINRDNTDDFISASISVSTTTNYSVETWFKANPNQGASYNALVSAWNAPGGGAGSWELQFYTGLLGVHPTYTVAYTPNTVAHAIYTQNGTETKIYLNGVLQQTSTTSGVDLRNGSIGIGNLSAPGYGGYNLEGTFYNVKLYNKTLTSSEVQQNYQATKDKFLGQNIVTNGLVAYVDATNKDSYPGTGTTWYDLSGNGNNFTFSSTPNVLNGLFNSGASVFAYRNAIPVDSSVNGYTLEACFKLNSSTGGGYQNITQNGGGDPTRHMMWYNGGSNSFLALFHTPNFYNNISDTLSLNTWYYLQLSYNPSGGGSNGRRAWLNGVEKTVNNTAVGNGTPSGYFTISVDSDLVSNKSDTSYAFVRYYNRYLTEAEITQNYNAQKIRFGL